MLLVAIVALVLGGWSNLVRRYQQFQIYRQLRHYHPIALDLWHGRLRQGDEVGRLIARASPHRRTRRGPYDLMWYYPGGPPPPGPPPPGSISLAATVLFAKEGVLLSAHSWGCTFDCAHFEGATARDDEEFAMLLKQSPGRRPDLGDLP
jgi:hypothetical protein